MKASWFVSAVACVLLLGCPGDIDWPEVDLLEIYDGANLVASVEPSNTSDTTIEEDVPSTSSFSITFSEPMDLTTAEGRIHIRDALGTEEPLVFTQRLQTITVSAEDGALTAGNNTLELEDGIEDTSGYNTLRSYIINFYVVP